MEAVVVVVVVLSLSQAGADTYILHERGPTCTQKEVRHGAGSLEQEF